MNGVSREANALVVGVTLYSSPPPTSASRNGSLFLRHPDSSQAPLIVSGGEDGTARMMHVQNKRVLGTLVHCAEGEVGNHLRPVIRLYCKHIIA